MGEISPSLARLLALHPEATRFVMTRQGKHVRERRGLDAPRIIATTPLALKNITHAGTRHCHEPGLQYTLVGSLGMGKRIAIGFIEAESDTSHAIELRITMARDIKEQELMKWLCKGLVRPVRVA
jgi:hypothetical protein